MFRKTKKKPKHLVSRHTSEDEDEDKIATKREEKIKNISFGFPTANPDQKEKNKQEGEIDKDGDDDGDGDGIDNGTEEGPTLVIRRKAKSKRKEGRKRGLNIVAGSDPKANNSDRNMKKTKKQKQRKRSTGLGFGGMTTMIDEDETDVFSSEGPASLHKKETPGTAPAYGKEALQALKAEQSRKPVQTKDSNDGAHTGTAPSLVENSEALETPEVLDVLNATDETTIEQNFISLKGEKQFQDNVLLQADGAPMVLEDPDDNDWEDQVAKRAGIQTTRYESHRPTVVTPSLDALRQNLNETIRHLSVREEDLSNTIMRREADLAQTKSDKIRQERSIATAGDACGEYQRLRYELAMWVGALRELNEKVTPIQTSLMGMIVLILETAEQEWKLWQNDVCAVLQDYGKVDRVLGRQPPNEGAGQATILVDEFGRDIGSQIRRDRDNRIRRRKELKSKCLSEQSEGQVAVLDSLIFDEEGTDRRYDLLQEALRVALEDLDESYANPKALVDTFLRWKNTNDEEYKQCYGDLSLSDLMSVFYRVELCRATWIRQFLKHDELFSFKSEDTLVIRDTIKLPETMDVTSGVRNTVYSGGLKKGFFPFFRQILTQSPSIIMMSSDISLLFGSYAIDMIQKLGSDSDVSQQIGKLTQLAVENAFSSVCMPLLLSTNHDGPTLDSDLQDATSFLSNQLPDWIQGMVLNIIKDWVPVVQAISIQDGTALLKTILSFLSESFLYFLSSFSNIEDAKKHFTPIWHLLVKSHIGLLESAEFIVQSAPLRAAASAYGLT